MTGSDLTKFGLSTAVPLDTIDRKILALLQDDCKTALARIGEAVGLSAPAVVERIRKLEEAGVITGYHAALDGRRIGLDVTAFIGVSINYPKRIEAFERAASPMAEVLEIHHVTGAHSLLLKVRTWNTATLETLISKLRSIDGVQRTDTMVVLSTRAERSQIAVRIDEAEDRTPKRKRAGTQGGPKERRQE